MSHPRRSANKVSCVIIWRKFLYGKKVWLVTHQLPAPLILWGVHYCPFVAKGPKRGELRFSLPFETMSLCFATACIAPVSAQPCAIASSATGGAQARFPSPPSQGRRKVRALYHFYKISFVGLYFLFPCRRPYSTTYVSGDGLKTVCPQRKLMQTVFPPFIKKYNPTVNLCV